MTPGSWLAFFAVGVPAIAALVVGLRNTSTTKQTANRSASLEEFDKLRIALRAELDSALTRIDALEDDVAEERTKREDAQVRAIAAEERAAKAEKRVERLQKRVHQLETVLREHHMPLPPEDLP